MMPENTGLHTIPITLFDLTEEDAGRFLVVPSLQKEHVEFFHPSSEDGAFRPIRFRAGQILLIYSVNTNVFQVPQTEQVIKINIFYDGQLYYRYERGTHRTPFLMLADEENSGKESAP